MLGLALLAVVSASSLVDASSAMQENERLCRIETNPAHIEACNRAIVHSPFKPQLYLWRGIIWSENKDLSRAIADYSSAIELDPTYFKAYICRGHARSNAGDFKGAEKDFNAALKLKPRRHEGYLFRSIFFEKSGRLDEALKDMDAAININPEPDLELRHGELKNKIIEQEELQSGSGKSEAVDSSDSSVFSEKAWAHYKDRNCPKAIEMINLAIALERNWPDYVLFRATLLKELEDYDGAIQDFGFALRFYPNHLNARLALAHVFLIKGSREDALRHATIAVEQHPKSAAAWAIRGMMREDGGDFDGARSDYRKVLDLEPDNIGIEVKLEDLGHGKQNNTTVIYRIEDDY